MSLFSCPGCGRAEGPVDDLCDDCKIAQAKAKLYMSWGLLAPAWGLVILDWMVGLPIAFIVASLAFSLTAIALSLAAALQAWRVS